MIYWNQIKKILFIIVLLALWLLFFVIFAKEEGKQSYGYSDMFLAQNASPWPNLSLTSALQSRNKAKIQEIIISKAKEFNIEPELFLRIAYCESGLKEDAQNPHSTASGIFQFLNSTFFNYALAYGLSMDDKNDPEVQAELAARIISDGGFSHWNASRSCWGN